MHIHHLLILTIIATSSALLQGMKENIKRKEIDKCYDLYYKKNAYRELSKQSYETLDQYAAHKNVNYYRLECIKIHSRVYSIEAPKTFDDIWDANDWALIIASLRGHEEMVADLLQLGAHKSIASNTPLMYAAAGGHWEVVEKLLAAGAVMDSCVWQTAILAQGKNKQDVLPKLVAKYPQEYFALCKALCQGYRELSIEQAFAANLLDVIESKLNDGTPISYGNLLFVACVDVDKYEGESRKVKIENLIWLIKQRPSQFMAPIEHVFSSEEMHRTSPCRDGWDFRSATVAILRTTYNEIKAQLAAENQQPRVAHH